MLYSRYLYHNSKDIQATSDLAELYLENDSLAKAKELSAKGLRMDSTHIRLLVTSGKTAYQLSDFETADKRLSRALELNGDSSAYLLRIMGFANYRMAN